MSKARTPLRARSSTRAPLPPPGKPGRTSRALAPVLLPEGAHAACGGAARGVRTRSARGPVSGIFSVAPPSESTT